MRGFSFSGSFPYSIGRNGSIKTTGIGITVNSDGVSVFPMTSRNKIANCCVSIPKDEIRKLIIELEHILMEQENDHEGI